MRALLVAAGWLLVARAARADDGLEPWNLSCRKPGLAGLCVATEPVKGETCVTTPRRYLVLPRDAKLAAAARAKAVGPAAAVFAADAELEIMLAVPAPAVTLAKPQPFLKWMDDFRKHTAVVSERYGAVAMDQAAPLRWRILATARIALLYRAIADSLGSVVMPREVARDADQRRAFCDAMAEKIAPVEKEAAEAHDVCLEGAGGDAHLRRICEEATP